VTAADPVAGLRREVIDDQTVGDELHSRLEERVIAVEAVLAARWPRSLLLRTRLARKLRRSVRGYQGHSFREQRWEATTVEWLTRRTA
jgi:hypothetical protein